MKRYLPALILIALAAGYAGAQDPNAAPRTEKRSFFSRVIHPFRSGSATPLYKDARLRGLVLEVQLSPQPVKLSEVRQLEVRAMLTNTSKRPVALDFSSDQRIEIYLLNGNDTVLAKWSDNHAFGEQAGTVFINPQEHVEYNETIATRELMPNKVFIAEVFFPKYPEVRVRQKFLTAP